MLSNKFTVHTDETCKQLGESKRLYAQWRTMLDALGMSQLAKECERVESELDGAINEAQYFRSRVNVTAKSLIGDSDDS